MPSIESPGSFNDFQLNHPGLNSEELRDAYGASLDMYRNELASEIGISVEDLHENGFRLTGIIFNEEGEHAA